MRTTKKYGKKADLALSMWVKLARAFSTFDKYSSESIRTFGLTAAQFAVLECLGHLGPMTIGALSKKMLFSGGNTTCVMDNLEKEGLVERGHDANDRRVINVQLTTKGQKLFDSVFSQHAEHIAKIASVLSESEQEDLGRLLKKLGRGLQDLKCPGIVEKAA
jgi:MarR family 2-MHQ and catechol resistance regulon transcriptional repressor